MLYNHSLLPIHVCSCINLKHLVTTQLIYTVSVIGRATCVQNSPVPVTVHMYTCIVVSLLAGYIESSPPHVEHTECHLFTR